MHKLINNASNIKSNIELKFSNIFNIKKLIQLSDKLEIESWPEGTRASKACFISRIEKFPQGFIFAYDQDKDCLMGLSTSMIIKLDDIDEINQWDKITSHGFINNHNPRGNILYVVSLGVSPNYREHHLGSELLQLQIVLGKTMGLDAIVLGSRVPGFHDSNLDIRQYIQQQDESGLSIDPLVKFYQKNNFKIHHINNNYMKNDKESGNYGVVMIQKL